MLQSIGTVFTLFMASLIGLNVYNYNQTDGNKIDYEFIVKYYNSKPAPSKEDFAEEKPVESMGKSPEEGVRLLESSSSLQRGRIPTEYIAYFLNHIHLAREVEKLYDIPAEICLAQAIHESGGGTSYLGRVGNNHHGIKAMKGLPHIKGKRAKWSKFESVDECYMAYGKITKRLLKAQNQDFSKVTPWDIARTPYAGKDNWDYARRLDEIILSYNLKEFVSKY